VVVVVALLLALQTHIGHHRGHHHFGVIPHAIVVPAASVWGTEIRGLKWVLLGISQHKFIFRNTKL